MIDFLLFMRLTYQQNLNRLKIIYLLLQFYVYSTFSFIEIYIFIIFFFQIINIGRKNSVLREKLANPASEFLLWIFGKVYTQFVLSYALVSFGLFSIDKWGTVSVNKNSQWNILIITLFSLFQVYWQVWYILHILLIVWFVMRGKIMKLARDSKPINGEVNRFVCIF